MAHTLLRTLAMINRSALLALVLVACSSHPDARARDADPHDAGGASDALPALPPDAAAEDPHTGFDVLTQHVDLARTGANLEETTLHTGNVGPASFGLLYTRQVDDEVYTQPLVVSDLALAGGRRGDVLYVATVNDTVYAFDADDPAATAPLWSRSLLGDGEVPPSNTDMVGACFGQYTDFSGHIGIVGTPVIDRASRTLYVVARSKRRDSYTQRLHALSLLDGSERPGSPVEIHASLAGSGDGSEAGMISFDAQKQNQRAGLTLVGGVVYIAWASHCDWGPYHGWIMGYDAHSLAQVVVWNATPDGAAGGIWQSGQGLSSDGTRLYAITGNGTVGDGKNAGAGRNRGESILALRRAGDTLAIDSYFTPASWPALEEGDLDLGSAGLLLVPGTKLGISGGKGGTLYVVDREQMGGIGLDGTDGQIVQSFPLGAGHLHGSPVYWRGPGPDGGRVYAWAEEDFLKAFPLLDRPAAPGTPALDLAHVQVSSVHAPDSSMPGGMLAISAHGSEAGTGIVWASLPAEGDANQAVVPGVLRAFDASDITHELWSSRLDPERDDCGKFAKFSCPSVANGKVYLASFSHQVCVYGLR